jgi:hypothetical protein
MSKTILVDFERLLLTSRNVRPRSIPHTALLYRVFLVAALRVNRESACLLQAKNDG